MELKWNPSRTKVALKGQAWDAFLGRGFSSHGILYFIYSLTIRYMRHVKRHRYFVLDNFFRQEQTIRVSKCF